MKVRPASLTVAAVLMALISLAGLPGPLLPGSEAVAVLVSAVIVVLVVHPVSRRALTPS